ncbi:MAG: alanine--tRNA ligase-related protein [Ilumatobacteraceae bacterium]
MAWTIQQIERTFIDYMVRHGHVEIEGHSVRSPTDDVLFTTAGMHPLTPYLKGLAKHPAGTRLTDVQRCVRTTDVDEVGDNTHLTVFEMLGNWSIGDYFKETSIPQSFGLLTGEFGIDPHSIYVTVFAGGDGLPTDDEATAIWEQTFADAGVEPTGRINPLIDNWWSNGPVGLCGPDTEIFVYVGDEPRPPFADIPQYVEIWNNVFMTFDRSATGELTRLAQRNVDTGMGLERLALFLDHHTSVWETDELHELTIVVGDTLGVDPDQLEGDAVRSLRIVTDHVRASLAIAAAGIQPSASRQGYVLRKLIRRAVRHGELLKGTDKGLAQSLIEATDRVSDVMGRRWPDVGPGAGGDVARETIDKEAMKFSKTLKKGVDHLQRLADESATFDGDLAFRLADTLGYPVELSAEEATRIGMVLDPGWQARYEARREEQRARSRG